MDLLFGASYQRTFATWFFATALWAIHVASQPITVPVRLQAELLSKVATYDREFVARAHGTVRVLVVVRPGDHESERLGEQVLGELRVLEALGGLRHSEEMVRYSSSRALGELCKERSATIVYLSTGLGERMPEIADALSGVSVLSVGITPSYVERRAVLGFDSESGRPKLVIHLGQARRQHVAFKPEVLALARVLP